MNQLKRNRGRHLGIALLLGIGILGTVFFFPINMNNQYTCLYHRMVSPGHSYPHHPIDILQEYVTPFGLLWWGSLLLTALGIYLWRHAAVPRPDIPVVKPAATPEDLNQP